MKPNRCLRKRSTRPYLLPRSVEFYIMKDYPGKLLKEGRSRFVQMTSSGSAMKCSYYDGTTIISYFSMRSVSITERCYGRVAMECEAKGLFVVENSFVRREFPYYVLLGKTECRKFFVRMEHSTGQHFLIAAKNVRTPAKLKDILVNTPYGFSMEHEFIATQ